MNLKTKADDLLKQYGFIHKQNNKYVHLNGKELSFDLENAVNCVKELEIFHKVDGEKEILLLLEEQIKITLK